MAKLKHVTKSFPEDPSCYSELLAVILFLYHSFIDFGYERKKQICLEVLFLIDLC